MMQISRTRILNLVFLRVLELEFRPPILNRMTEVEWSLSLHHLEKKNEKKSQNEITGTNGL